MFTPIFCNFAGAFVQFVHILRPSIRHRRRAKAAEPSPIQRQ
jgi:hypothetical protein